MKKFENELTALRQRLVQMGNLAESMVVLATQTITDRHNDALFKQIGDNEEQLDRMQIEVDKEAVRLLAVFTPVASDLRFILSVSRMNTELERIGDNAVNLCEGVQLMVSKTDAEPLPKIQKMAGIVRGMVSDSLNAFLHNDSSLAHAMIAKDDMVDVLNDELLNEVLSDQVVRDVLVSHKNVAGALSQVLIARSLERIADQCTNIGEEVIYMVKGQDIRHSESVTKKTRSFEDSE